ncbi:putative Ig domain-containing protein [Pseudomonas sp. BMS12]|uniref:putative Ig domain-containing protein n=1 Tax=Pseudomonas sp. BMS12 TaxID=1796033 RepID=UPI00083B4A24|nr:putative Ig domain-containing protein [Pseudomonas sp. BMS12]
MFKQWMAGLLALWSVGAWAEDKLCAVVLIEIAQELTLERQAFEATMRINNGLDTINLDTLKVNVLFEDDKGNVVKASSDPNATDADFFIRLDDSNNVNSLQSGADGAITNGVVPAKASGVLRWLIIPTAGAAGDSLSGKRYNVGASLSYNAGGKTESLTVTPDTITVKPQPELTLDYFLTKEVIADDAFTPAIEAPEPYTLGVRVRNSGRGEAKSLKIESAQPKIVGNDLGLAINFRITHSFVDDAPAAPTLLIDFGSVAPGKNRNGRWLMESTLSGQFIDFKASFSHPDELGGKLTSLLDAVNTHFLLRDVLVDLPTRDRVRDFLGFVGDDLYVFESDSVGQTDNAPCVDCAAVASLNGVLSGGSTLRTLSVSDVQPGFGYVRVADPYAGSKGLQRVVRSSGGALSSHNAWLSKERAEDGETFKYYLNIFDTTPDAQYTVEFGDLTQEPKPPVFMPISDRSTYEGGQVGFLVRASDPNGTVPKLFAEGLPTGATFKDDGGGSGTFYWTPLQGQAGRYVVSFRASDGSLDTSLPVGIRVFREGDSDGDGMDDAWEQEQFGNLDRDGTGDFDGDGVSDLDEYELGTDPKEAELTPLPPQLDTPTDNAQVTALYPTLRVQNSANGQGKNFKYWFEIYEDESHGSLVAKSDEIVEGAGYTEWAVTEDDLIGNASLKDNRRYYWRARVTHASGSSEWINGRFFINQANDAPSAPTLLNPTPMGLVAEKRPTFQFNNSFDVDEDALSYRVRVFSEQDDEFTSPVVEVTGLQPGVEGVTEWQSPTELEENGFYLWLVEAVDEHGAVTQSEPSMFGVSLSNEAPSEPVLAWPLQDQRIDKAEAVLLRLDAANDPERQPLRYRIQLDTSERFDSGAMLDSDWITATQAQIEWTVPATLSENQHYYWRARASDGEQESAWRTGRFQVNQFQEAPAAPVVANPASGAWVEVRTPRLEVHPVVDPDGDAVSYEFALHSVEGNEPLATQVVAELGWSASFPLQDNSDYRWRVRAIDATGLNSPWSEWQHFFVNENGVDDAPALSFVLPDKEQTLTGGSVLIQWTDQDPDSAATIDLLANGQPIATGLAEDEDGDADHFEWSLAGVQPGTYSISAVIRDASSNVAVEACCSVTVLPPTPQIRVTPLGNTQLDEFGEAVAEIEVALDRGPQPGMSVMLNLALSDDTEARLLNQQPYLYFTAENWQQPQRIRVQGVDDCEIDGDQAVSLQLLPLQSSDSSFAGLDPADVLLNNRDNESEQQTLFVCHYQVVSRSEPDGAGMVEITLRPELSNRGVALQEATATPSLQGTDLVLAGSDEVRFSKVLNGVRSQAHDTIVLRQPAAQPLMTSRLHWAITPGAVAPVTEGQDGDDTLVGSNGDDIINGGGGNDWMVGGDGDDTLIGGAGADVMFGGIGDDTFIVQGNDASADVVNGGEGYDRMLGGDGDDVLRLSQFANEYRVELIDGGAGHNRIEGTEGDDALDFSSTELRNIELIDGLGGNDVINGSAGNDVIRGAGGNDTLLGNAGDDRFLFTGDQGVDLVVGGAGADRIEGSDGDDWIRLRAFDAEQGVEVVDGGDGLNFVTGDDAANTLDFRSSQLLGITRIDGLGGNDVIAGSAGNDVIQGGSGDDVLYGQGGDDVFLMTGMDTGFDLVQGDEGNDGIKGGSGDDIIGLRGFGSATSTEWIDGDGGVNKILGGSDDTVFDFRATRLIAIAEIDLGEGNDTFYGSADADVVRGGVGNDTLSGGAGNDTFRVVGASDGIDLVDGGEGTDRILGDDGDTVIGLSQFAPQLSVELVDGAAGQNVIRGSTGDDYLDFSATELRNIQLVDGAAGNDQIRGSTGNDTITGGLGNDQLYGWHGNDTYRFKRGDGVDAITDYGLASDQDKLVFVGLASPEEVWLKRVGNNMEVTLVGSVDKVTLVGVYVSGENLIETIEVEGKWRLPAANAAQLAQFMTTIPENPASRTAQQKASLQSALSMAWIAM